jgi:hypothetical protein
VVLRDKPTVPAEALALAWDLEARGFDLQVEAGQLRVRPGQALTAADREAIRRWRVHLLAILAYVDQRFPVVPSGSGTARGPGTTRFGGGAGRLGAVGPFSAWPPMGISYEAWATYHAKTYGAWLSAGARRAA